MSRPSNHLNYKKVLNIKCPNNKPPQATRKKLTYFSKTIHTPVFGKSFKKIFFSLKNLPVTYCCAERDQTSRPCVRTSKSNQIKIKILISPAAIEA
jgi:hypothetical protein